MTPERTKEIEAEAKQWSRTVMGVELNSLHETQREIDAYIAAATKYEGEIESKDQEIQRLKAEIKTCEELAAIRSTLIKNLNDLNEAQSVELTAYKEVSAKMAEALTTIKGVEWMIQNDWMVLEDALAAYRSLVTKEEKKG